MIQINPNLKSCMIFNDFKKMYDYGKNNNYTDNLGFAMIGV